MTEFNLLPGQVSVPLTKSPWRKKKEKEVAGNIISILRKKGNAFRYMFSLRDYQTSFSGPKDVEEVLKSFVETGFLKKDGSKYKITWKMMSVYWQNLSEFLQ